MGVLVTGLVMAGAAKAAGAEEGAIHLVFSTECTGYFDWQTAGMFASVHAAYTAAGLPVPQTTRLMACGSGPEPDGNAMSAIRATEDMGRALCGNGGVCDVHRHPNYRAYHGDVYSAYNKPGSVKHWLEHYAKPITAEYVVFLDADQLVRKPISIRTIGLAKGRPVSAYYGYLIGVFDDNHMGVKAKMKRENKMNAPLQQVGGFFAHHIDDLRRVAPPWFEYTHAVRTDPDSWARTGDVFNCPRLAFEKCQGKECRCPGPPWISEMYGYVFGASEAGLNHNVNNYIMVYPGYDLKPFDKRKNYPMVLHYGLRYIIDLGPGNGYWTFDKHEFMSGDPFKCDKPSMTGFERPPPMSALPIREDLRTQRIGLWTAWSIFNATMLMRHFLCDKDEWSAKAGGSSANKFFEYQQAMTQRQRDAMVLESTLASYDCKNSNPVFGCFRMDKAKLRDMGSGNMGANLAFWPDGFKGTNRPPPDMHDGDYDDLDLPGLSPGWGSLLRGSSGAADTVPSAEDGDGECANDNANCCIWASTGECGKNPGFMEQSCRAACHACADTHAPTGCAESSSSTSSTTPAPTTFAPKPTPTVPRFGELGDAQRVARTPEAAASPALLGALPGGGRTRGVGADVVATVQNGSMLAYTGWIAALVMALRSLATSRRREGGGGSTSSSTSKWAAVGPGRRR